MLVSKVLVAVDGSENSERALNFALNFADKYGASLTMINVTESSALTAMPYDMNGYPGNSMASASVAQDLRKFHQGILDKAAEHAKTVKPNLPVEVMLKEGNPAAEISSVANECNFDVVIIGHRGIGKVRELFMGSICEKVVHTVNSTIIIVK